MVRHGPGLSNRVPHRVRRRTSLLHVRFATGGNRAGGPHPGVSVKKRRVLALLHEYLVPPDDVRGVDVVNASWKTEYDVTNTLAAMGHDVYIVGLDDTL